MAKNKVLPDFYQCWTENVGLKFEFSNQCPYLCRTRALKAPPCGKILKLPYSILPNRRVYTFISGQVCLLGSIKVKRQTLPEINVYTRLFGSIEYMN